MDQIINAQMIYLFICVSVFGALIQTTSLDYSDYLDYLVVLYRAFSLFFYIS
jgi:hypothetical protein